MTSSPKRYELEKSTGEIGNPQDPADNAKIARIEYVRTMLVELQELAAGMDEKMLSYLIGMAALEAEESAGVKKFRTEFQSGA